MYADAEYYANTYGGKLEGDELKKALAWASRHIDTLTYNRIVFVGLENLTKYQQEVIKESCCLMADFETDNADYINSMLTSYSLNGASMSFGGESATATVVNGVVVSRDIYAHLSKCGLCCKSAGGWRK